MCNHSLVIIGLSLHDDVALVKKFLVKGTSVYLSKNTSKEELLTIDAVMKDELYLGMEIREKLNASSGQLPQSDLTGKEI
jgi:DNA-binding NarL/FixJ family response regulator